MSDFKPCGSGDNICNCKSQEECGYARFYDDTDDTDKLSQKELTYSLNITIFKTLFSMKNIKNNPTTFIALVP